MCKEYDPFTIFTMVFIAVTLVSALCVAVHHYFVSERSIRERELEDKERNLL